jgi:hypothetical protein
VDFRPTNKRESRTDGDQKDLKKANERSGPFTAHNGRFADRMIDQPLPET